MYPFVAESLSTALECLFYNESHSYNLGTNLCSKVKYTVCSIAVGKEIIDEKALIILMIILLCYCLNALWLTAKCIKEDKKRRRERNRRENNAPHE